MNDKISEELLSAYLDGELSLTERADVERLLESSPAAQQQLADFQKLSQWMHELPAARPPQGFAGQVLHQAERRSLLRETAPAATVAVARRAWLKPTLGIAAAAAAVVFLVRAVPDAQPVKPQAEANAIALEMDASADKDVATLSAEPATEAISSRAIEGAELSNFAEAAPADDSGSLIVAPDDMEKLVAKKPLGLSVPEGEQWNRDRIGEVINLTKTDPSKEEATVFKAVVVDINKWSGGTQLDLIGMDGDSRTFAVYLEASREELAELVAEITEEGNQLLELKAGEPIQIAQLPQVQQTYYASLDEKFAEEASDSELSVQKNFTARTPQPSHVARDVPTPAAPAQEGQAARRGKPARADSGEAESAPITKREKKEVPQDTRRMPRFQLSAVPKVLESQITPHLEPFTKVPAESRTELSEELAKTPGDSEGGEKRQSAGQSGNAAAPQRVRMILLVRQQPKQATPEKPPAEKASDGGGAA